jgi:hypothetical protein
MKAKEDLLKTKLEHVQRPNPTWFVVRGLAFALPALFLLWRAPDYAVMAVAFAFISGSEWVKFQRAKKRWAELQAHLPTIPTPDLARPATPKQELPPLLVSRRARTPGGGEWTAARSWLGGLPRLGMVSWPRSKTDGRPLPFLAQIDLAEVAKQIGPSPLPASGALAFFVGDRPVLYLPEQPATAPFSQLPADAPTLDEAGFSGAGITSWPKDPLGPRVFPFWPVDLTVVRDEVSCRAYNFTAREAFRQLGDEPRPFWWHSALHLSDCLRIAVSLSIPNTLRVRETSAGANAQRATALQQFRQGIPAFEQFAAEVASWTEGRDSWELLAPADVQRLEAIFQRARQEFQEYTRFCIPHSMDELSTVTLIALATAEERGYATLPEPIRHLINEKYLLPPGHTHQMFGEAIDIQGGVAEEAEANYLLLRLNYDDMLHWGFGDNGAYHFFLSPRDLADRKWEGARIMFECH